MSSKEQPDVAKMKKQFDEKPKSEQQEILKEDQLKAISVDEQLEKKKKQSAFNVLMSKLDALINPDNYKEEKYIFSDKDIQQNTQRIEGIPIILAESIKLFLSYVEESNFVMGVHHNLYQEDCIGNQEINKKDIDYIAHRFQTQFKTKLVDLKDGSKRIDIVPEGSKIKTQNDITIDRLSIVFQKSHSDKDKYFVRLECVKG
ncbi:MAG TPA: hypothetical protein P5241_02460 [Candidatus Paceibacterota bacterium]|nr:hypothetical protein [Candidatus Paceibacterota bacterium]